MALQKRYRADPSAKRSNFTFGVESWSLRRKNRVLSIALPSCVPNKDPEKISELIAKLLVQEVVGWISQRKTPLE